MRERYSPKSHARRVVIDIENAVIEIEYLSESQGFSKGEQVFWNKVRNELNAIANKITQAYRKQ